MGINFKTFRLRYTQFFIISLLAAALLIATRSLLVGGIPQLETNLWGRQFLIGSFTRLRLKLGDRVYAQALVGKQGWLEYTGGMNLDGYQNAIPTSPGALESMQVRLNKLYEGLRKRNITFLLVISPNKATIYPDKLPDELKKIGAQSKIDALAEYLQLHGPPVLVDLRPRLQRESAQQDLYYKTDTHWNTYGAFWAYQEIMLRLAKSYSQLVPHGISDFSLKVLPANIGGISRMMALPISEDQPVLTALQNNMRWVTYNDDATMPLSISTSSQAHPLRLLMYMDSFGEALKGFFAPHFSQATFVQINSKYPDLLTFKAIETNKPDIIIIEIVERSFNTGALDVLLNKLLKSMDSE